MPSKKRPSNRRSVASARKPRSYPPPPPHHPAREESPGRQQQRTETKSASVQVLEPGANEVPVVGIGASAGGVEAFSELLHALAPDTGMAFVLVQHLSPSHPSVLTEILGRTTTMPTREVQDGMRLEPNNIYVIPPNADLALQHGVLQLMPRSEEPGHLHLPIDYFFLSLASDLGSRAIGVVLSGTASDGTMGLKAIKAEGGITFAQDEKSARYDGMPRSAIMAGYADFVMRPQEIARELTRLGRHPYVRQLRPGTELPNVLEGETDYNKMLLLVRSTTGVDFTYYKHTTIKRRIVRRMLLQQTEHQREYLTFLQANPAEVWNLYNDILINVTSFFRDPETFDALGKLVFPTLMEDRSPDDPIRIWIPGCSSGEEAYSVAICLLEYLGEKASQTTIQIFATDISDVALDKARQGVFPEGIHAEVSAERLRRFFTRTEAGYQIRKSLRDMCIFAKQNLSKDPPFSRLDLISCRNLLIYMDAALHKKILPIFYYALKPRGMLLLGASETVGGSVNLFSLVDRKFKFYAKKVSHHKQPLEFLGDNDTNESGRAVKKPQLKDWQTFDVQKEADRMLLARFAPDGVIINEELEIVHFRGHTGNFLEPASGEASLDVLKMARDGLLYDLQIAIMKAKKENMPVRRERVLMQTNGTLAPVNIEVIPINNAPAGARYFLIMFEQAAMPVLPTPAGMKKQGRKKRQEEDREFNNLKQDLTATKEYLQSIIEEQEATNEELRSANEEIQSSNEEMQSTNEEMETAKEELQSTNEELNTLNDALENRNAELTQLNNDLLNLLSSVHVPIIILGNDLRIRRYTPSAERVLNVIPTDIGRKISDIRFDIGIPELEHLLLDVIETLHTEEREVQDNHGNWYAMRVRPYKTTENQIDGVVIVFFDISEVKRTAERLRVSTDMANNLLEIIEGPVAVLDAECRVLRVNPAFATKFRVAGERLEGEKFFNVCSALLDIPPVREAIERATGGGSQTIEQALQLEMPALGARDLLLTVRTFRYADASIESILIHVTDRTGL